MIKLTRTKTYNGAGIYMIQSSINDKVYIGQSIHISNRVFKSHIRELMAGKHINRHLQNHVNKHLPDYNSIEDFLEFSVVWRCSRSRLTENEQEWIDKFPKKQRFNICDKAEVAIRFEEQPEWRQKEIIEKMRMSQKIYRNSPEGNKRTKEEAKRRWNNTEYRVKLSKERKQRWADPEYREKMIKAHLTPEYKEKILALLENTEYKKKLSAASTKMWKDPNHRSVISLKSKESWKVPLVKEARCVGIKESWNNFERRLKCNDPIITDKISKSVKKLWADPEYREKQSIARKAAWAKRKAVQQEAAKMQRTIFHNQN